MEFGNYDSEVNWNVVIAVGEMIEILNFMETLELFVTLTAVDFWAVDILYAN